MKKKIVMKLLAAAVMAGAGVATIATVPTEVMAGELDNENDNVQQDTPTMIETTIVPEQIAGVGTVNQCAKYINVQNAEDVTLYQRGGVAIIESDNASNAPIMATQTDANSVLIFNGNEAVNSITTQVYNDGLVEAWNFDLLGAADLIEYLQNRGVIVSGNGWFATYTAEQTANRTISASEQSITTEYANSNTDNYYNSGRYLTEMIQYHNSFSTGTSTDGHTFVRVPADVSAFETVKSTAVDPYVIYTTVPVKDGYTQAQIDELTNCAIAAQQAEQYNQQMLEYYETVAIPQATMQYDYYVALGFQPVVCSGTVTMQQVADMYGMTLDELLAMNPLWRGYANTNDVLPAYAVLVVG